MSTKVWVPADGLGKPWTFSSFTTNAPKPAFNIESGLLVTYSRLSNGQGAAGGATYGQVNLMGQVVRVRLTFEGGSPDYCASGPALLFFHNAIGTNAPQGGFVAVYAPNDGLGTTTTGPAVIGLVFHTGTFTTMRLASVAQKVVQSLAPGDVLELEAEITGATQLTVRVKKNGNLLITYNYDYNVRQNLGGLLFRPLLGANAGIVTLANDQVLNVDKFLRWSRFEVDGWSSAVNIITATSAGTANPILNPAELITFPLFPDDICITTIHTRTAPGQITPPPGWTFLARYPDEGNITFAEVYVKQGPPFSGSWNTSNRIVLVIQTLFRNTQLPTTADMSNFPHWVAGGIRTEGRQFHYAVAWHSFQSGLYLVNSNPTSFAAAHIANIGHGDVGQFAAAGLAFESPGNASIQFGADPVLNRGSLSIILSDTFTVVMTPPEPRTSRLAIAGPRLERRRQDYKPFIRVY